MPLNDPGLQPGDLDPPREVEWEPGSLSSTELDRVLTDAIADLWADAYRQGNAQAQRRIFRQRLSVAVYSATGTELTISSPLLASEGR